MKSKIKKHDSKIRSGFRVIGNNTAGGEIFIWYFPDLEQAKAFSKQLSEDTGKEVEIFKHIGSYKPILPAIKVEFIQAADSK